MASVDLKTLLTIWQFLAAIAPLVAQLYDACRQLFPDGTPGATKLDAFKSLLQQAVATMDELKKFEPVFNQAWPLVKTMVDSFHTFRKAVDGDPTNDAPK